MSESIGFDGNAKKREGLSHDTSESVERSEMTLGHHGKNENFILVELLRSMQGE